MSTEAGSGGWLLIRAGRLIDGTGRPVLNDAAVLIRGDRIIEVGTAASITSPGSAVDLRRLSLADCTLLPGLIDAHFHAGYCGHIGMQQLEWPATLEYASVQAGANAHLVLERGCTSAFDVGCRGNLAVAVRKSIREGSIRGPRLRVSGQILWTPAMDLWASDVRINGRSRLFAIVSGEEEIRSEIRKQASSGVDNIKLQITRSTVQQATGGSSVTFTKKEMAAAVEAAHDAGLSIAAHAEGPEGVIAAVEAGFDTVHHASFIDDRTVDALERRPETRVVFTLGVYDSIIRNGPTFGYPSDSITRVIETWPSMVNGVELASRRGVPFGLGSDAGGRVHPQGHFAHEIVLMVKDCGLTIEAAIQAATIRSAEAAWLKDLGTLERGRIADLVAFRGDLTKQIDVLDDPNSVVAVVQGGRVVAGGSTEVDTSRGLVAAGTGS